MCWGIADEVARSTSLAPAAGDHRAVPRRRPVPDPYALYDDLCRITGQRHDPCLLDTFIAAVRYVEGAPKTPWWEYTAERKRVMAARSAAGRQG
jgi:hypothetical protein